MIMEVNIGPVLINQRKQHHITQQQLADFVGVSKAAVSKWETGQSYPDITLLPSLAAYFNLQIDDLLDYEPQLSTSEIQNIYNTLKKSFTTESGEEVLTKLRSLIRRYYACYPFIQQMGLLILNHFTSLPGKNVADKQARYVAEARQLFIHVRENTDDTTLKLNARNLEAYTLILLHKPQEVLTLLGTATPTYLPAENLIATAYQMQHDTEKAQAVYQSAMYQHASVGMNYFTNYLTLLTADPAKFTETYRRGRAYAEIFKMATLNPLVYLNFLLATIMGLAQQQQTTMLFQVLTHYVDVLSRTEFPPVLHGDAYFDQIDDWLDNLDSGHQTPRNATMVQQQLVDIIQQDPTLAAYRSDKRWLPLARKLKEVGQHGPQ